MGEKKAIVRNSIQRIRVVAVFILVICAGVFGFNWYGLHQEYVRNHRAWFDFQEQKLMAFYQLGMQKYEAFPEMPGLNQVGEYMKSSFDPDISNRYVEIDAIIDKDASTFPYHGKVSLYVDGDGDQICAYGDTGILGLKYPVFFRNTDAALKYAFPYMEDFSDNQVSMACIDPDTGKYRAFADVAEKLFRSGDVWAEKDGFTFKKVSVLFWNGNTGDVIISRENPGEFHTYGRELLQDGLIFLAAWAGAILIGWVWLILLQKRARRIEEDPVEEEEREARHREKADELYAFVDGAINSLGPKPEFDRIRDSIDEVRERAPKLEVREKVQGISEKGRRFLRFHETVAQVVLLLLAGTVVVASASLTRRRAYEQILDSRIREARLELRSVDAQGEADLQDLIEKLGENQMNVARYLTLGVDYPYRKSNSMNWISEKHYSLPDNVDGSDTNETMNGFLSEVYEFLHEKAIEDDYEMFFQSSGVVVQSISNPDHRVVSLDMNEEAREVKSIVMSNSRPDERDDAVRFCLPYYLDRDGRILAFNEGIIYFQHIVMLGQRFYQSDEAGDKQYSNVEVNHICERIPQVVPENSNPVIEREAKWIRITKEILDASKTSGWEDEIWFHSYIEKSNDWTTGREYVLFEPGYDEWENWTKGTVKTALVASAWILIAFLSLKLVEIRSSGKKKVITSESEATSSSEQDPVWKPILERIDEAEKEWGTIGYLEDLRKKIEDFK